LLTVFTAAAADKAFVACQSQRPAISIAGCNAFLAKGEGTPASDRAIAYYNRGNAFFGKGDMARAIDDYSASIDLNPEFADAHFNRGNGYFNSGDLDRAIADYDTVIALSPGYLNAYVNRGNAHRQKGEFDLAFADYAAALKLDPNNRLALGNRKQALAEQAAKPKQAEPPKAVVMVTAPAPASPAIAAPIVVAEKRVALVVGNSAYAAVARLPNPVRDAAAMAAALKADGFAEVTLIKDADRAQLVAALNRFADEAATADWAVLYYAGHGIELDGTNYLIPVDARLKTDRDVQDEAVSLDRVVTSVEPAKKLRLVVLDACRNNPFAVNMRLTDARRAISRGLARIEPAGGTLVAYAAKGGQEAIDGEGTGNSPFAAALVKNLQTPGLEIGKLFRLVRDDVLAATDQKQEPFVYGSLPGEDFFFRPQ
jgi:Flp pilus assembly protein TadD